ncbi:MAG TPA: serine/threonine-protein kinase, partial [Gemmatimonadaceae bacterium]|nr:serine/threonine-protein kinase [Gemmatimonadaceae bacterium]
MGTFEQRLRETLSQSYDIERELGGGGMSRVFVATDKSLGRKVVIKLLSPELTADVNRGRFRREIQVAARLQHPHIVALLSAGEHEDFVYYTMPFIAGESLKTAIEKNGPLPVEDVVRVMYHVGEALDYAHGEGVVHRDIKPANILRQGNYFLVTDFGVAKALNAAMPDSVGMTATGMAVGTPAYMAPEQLAGDTAADHRIDIYALGLLAYELLHGKSPFAGTTPQRTLAAVLTQDPPPLKEVRPDVPARLSEIVMRCLSKEPDERPASAKALLAELDTFSTASGEIRTTEHLVPRRERSLATPVSSAPVEESVAPVKEPTPVTEVLGVGYDPPPKPRTKMVGGVFALLIPLAAAAVYFTVRAGDTSSADSALAVTAAPVADSVAMAPPPPAAAPESLAGPAVPVAPAVDSQRIRDSVRKAARAEAAKKAAARAESLRQAQETPRTNARRAAAAMLADENARRAFARGATRMGGPLGTRRRGDLQTQIDAL